MPTVSGVSMCTSANPKIRTMYFTENPLMSTMALPCIVATTYYNLKTNTNQSEIEGYLGHNNVPEGVGLMYKLIAKA